jgi:polar amino acid transport system substrate-binding protein
MKLKTASIRILLAALLACLFAACGKGPARNELVVGMDLSYPPFETINPEGEPTGVSVDLARSLGEYLGRPVRIENIPFVGLIPSLQTGKIDCVISSMTDTPERRESISFSDPYLTIGLAMLVGKNSGITDLATADAPGKTIAVRQGTTGQVWATAHIKKAGLVVLDRESYAVLEVIQGKADAFIYDQMSVWQNWQRNPTTTTALLQPLDKEYWAVGLKKGDTALLGQVNAFLKEFRAAGGFDKLGDKYLGAQKEAFKKLGIPFYF